MTGRRAPGDRPVFHDRSGRRRRWVTLAFASLGVALVATLGTLVLALTGTSPVPLPGFPQATHRAEREPAPTTTPARETKAAPQGTATSTTTTSAATTTSVPQPTATKRGNRPTTVPSHSKPPKHT